MITRLLFKNKKSIVKNKLIIPTFTIAVILLLPTLLHAQPGFGGGEDVVDTPIDGGLSLLLAAGVGYASKKLNDKRKA